MSTSPVMTAAEIQELLARVFPQAVEDFRIVEIGPMRATLKMPIADKHLRPGGTVSGPSMFALADYGFYVATLAMIGPEPLTVTTNLAINFMRKPEPVDLICEVRLLKLGRSLSVGDALLYSDGMDAPVAQATATYAIPPRR